jgi:Uma2 family endonuclease
VLTTDLSESRPFTPQATLAEWLAQPEERAAELIRGKLVYKALPSPAHGRAQGKLYAQLDPYDRRASGAGKPGGWWLSLEVDLELGGEGVRPDLVGWRRARVPTLPRAAPGKAIVERPDWVCEVLSPTTASRDLGEKLAIYHRAEVTHYWIVDPLNRTLTVYRWTGDGYVVALGCGGEMTVRAEPFGDLEIHVGVLFEEAAPEEPSAPSSIAEP